MNRLTKPSNAKRNIVLRIDAEYSNIGDMAINRFAIECLLSKGQLSILAPNYERFLKSHLYSLIKKINLSSSTKIAVCPDIGDIIKPNV